MCTCSVQILIRGSNILEFSVVLLPCDYNFISANGKFEGTKYSTPSSVFFSTFYMQGVEPEFQTPWSKRLLGIFAVKLNSVY